MGGCTFTASLKTSRFILQFQILKVNFVHFVTMAAASSRGLRDIMPPMLPDLNVEDIVRLRKPHPCGSFEWRVTRLGADIGLVCQGCGRRILLPRRELARRLKRVVHSAGSQHIDDKTG